MDPFSLMMLASTGIGLGMKLFGSSGSAEASRQISEASGRIAGFEQKENAQRKQQMILTSQRQQLQNVRNTQMARSMALTSSTSQGAQTGSGLQGGFGQIQGQSDVNIVSNAQNLQIGKNIFALDDQISEQKKLIAQYQGNLATSQGLSAMGGDIMGASGQIGRLSGFFGSSGGSNSGGGFNSGGYGYLGGNTSADYIG